MTAVAGLEINNYPLLVGDLLLSGPNESTGFSVPTVDDLSTVFPAGSGFTPSGLSQKITLISEDVMIAWAGNKLAASYVIKELSLRSCSIASHSTSHKMDQHQIALFMYARS
jgi:hypothetical protein